ncbi:MULTISPECIES: YbaB/EbfC family nucleoid-associated protein [Amycolatopsis]|uniref:YbaB/EbfC family nucleoid-associated protein n=1 Tax=Amycolatopsis TaxID=1813 RepID=UPI003817F1D2
MSEFAQQLLRRIEAIDTAAADNRRRAQAYEQMAGELKDVTAEAVSPDGAVRVVAGAGGEVKAVTFGERVRDLPPAALSAAVMHTLAVARAAAARQQAEVVRRGLGDTELLDRVLDADENTFGDQRPKHPGPAPVFVPPREEEPLESADQLFEERPAVPPPPPPAPTPVPPRAPAAHRRPPAQDDEPFEETDLFADGSGR